MREASFGGVGEELLLAKLTGGRGAIRKVKCDLSAKYNSISQRRLIVKTITHSD